MNGVTYEVDWAIAKEIYEDKGEAIERAKRLAMAGQFADVYEVRRTLIEIMRPKRRVL